MGLIRGYHRGQSGGPPGWAYKVVLEGLQEVILQAYPTRGPIWGDPKLAAIGAHESCPNISQPANRNK